MLTINNYQDTLISKRYPLSFKELDLDKSSFLKNIRMTEIVIDDLQDDTLTILIKHLVLKLKLNYNIYFIFHESIPQPKSKIRSFKKIFHSYRSFIGERNLFESELDINNQSILTSIIRLTPQNLDFLLENFINSNLSFGFISPKKKRTFKKNRKTYLEDLKEYAPNTPKLFKVNIIKLLHQNLTEDNCFFKLKNTGKDEELIHVFEKESKFSEIITPIIKNIDASSSSLNKNLE